MSDMQRNRGIIKRLSTKENVLKVYDDLVNNGKIEHPEWTELNADGSLGYIDDPKYAIVDGAIFDVTGAPDDYDSYDDVNEAERLNETDYRVHAYYYNGGASFNEMLSESIPKADAEYEAKGKKDTFYAIKFKDGRYWSRGTNASPSTFSSESRARGTANSVSVGLNPDSYDIVKLVEQ